MVRKATSPQRFQCYQWVPRTCPDHRPIDHVVSEAFTFSTCGSSNLGYRGSMMKLPLAMKACKPLPFSLHVALCKACIPKTQRSTTMSGCSCHWPRVMLKIASNMCSGPERMTPPSSLSRRALALRSRLQPSIVHLNVMRTWCLFFLRELVFILQWQAQSTLATSKRSRCSGELLTISSTNAE